MGFHNHVLPPDCDLHDDRRHALVLEVSGGARVLVSYSDAPLVNAARSVAALVHGEDAVRSLGGSGAADDLRPEAPTVVTMLRRARQLMAEGRHFHHHVLFPDCIFNPHAGRWTIVFEDPDSAEMLESVTEHRPAADIEVTERLFFSQSSDDD